MNNRAFRLSFFVVFLVAMLGLSVFWAYAEEVCETYWDPVNQIWVTVCSGTGGGSGGGSGGGGSGGGSGGACTPGTTTVSTVIIGGSGLCEVWEIWHDVCTGQVVFANLIDVIVGGSCSPEQDPGSAIQANPCTVLSVTAAGVYCQTEWGIQWMLDANVGFPAAFLDLRPYPVTLIRWSSAARNGGTPPAAGTGALDYIAYGGGSESNPAIGDWRNVQLKLILSPASPLLFFSMPTIGTLSLPDVGETGTPVLLVFEKPSHPSAGATIMSGDVGLSELPDDFPLFSGSAVTAYRLFWRLSYEKYTRTCFPGPDPQTGSVNCLSESQSAVLDGHWVYDWKNKGMGGEITPQMVPGLPSSMAADLDGDGSPDAYWNRRVVIRRMDDSNHIDNPQWSGSWNWGGAVYWAVREGQGQIGWP